MPLVTFRSQVSAVLVAGIGLVVGACGGPPPEAAQGGAGGFGSAGGMEVPVIAERVDTGPFVDRFNALGTAKANESIEVTSRTASVITRIRFEEGQQVSAGQVLLELDTRQESANLSLAEAQLAQAESQFRRSERLAETQVVSAADLDQLQANLQVARAQVRGARARLDILYVKAPFAGTVGLRSVSLGDLVGPDTLITTLDDTRTIRLEFTIPETFLADLDMGMTVDAASPVYPGRTFTGKVTSIDTRVDPVGRSVTAIAMIPNADNVLKPGMFLTVALEKRRNDVLMIPEEALVPRQGRQYVFVVENGRALEKEVTLGSRAPGLVEIREGIEPGSMVITEGTQRVRSGGAVRLTSDS